MARILNLWSKKQSQFVTDGLALFGGWGVGDDDDLFSLRAVTESGPYRLYGPEGDLGTVLIGSPRTSSTDTVPNVVLASPRLSAESNLVYAVLFTHASFLDVQIRVDMRFFDASDAEITSPVSHTVSSSSTWNIFKGFYFAPENTISAQVIITYFLEDDMDGNSVELGTDNSFAIYDPSVFRGTDRTDHIAATVYTDIPEVFRVDDEDNTVEGRPLLGYIQSLSRVIDQVNSELIGWSQEFSGLGDPNTNNILILRWLASLLGVLPKSGFTSGSATWEFLESANLDADMIAGEWEDWELYDNWRGLQNSAAGFVSELDVLRPLVKTGATGLHAGRSQILHDLLVAELESEGIEEGDIFVGKGGNDRKDIIQVFVNQSSFVGSELVNQLIDESSNASIGHTITHSILDTACGCLNFERDTDNIIEVDPVGADDKAGFGRHLVNIDRDSVLSTSGGFVGTAKHSDGASFYLGGGARHQVTTASSDYSILENDVDIIICLSDVQPVFADNYETHLPTQTDEPDGWYFRNKQPLLYGLEERWALYIASGLTPGKDNDTRFLWVENYHDARLANIVYSDPIELGRLQRQGNWCLRVTREQSTGAITFFAQENLFDQWDENIIGTGTIGAVATHSATARMTVGGSILEPLADNRWASHGTGANGLVHRVMVSRSITDYADSAGQYEGVVSSEGTVAASREGAGLFLSHTAFNIVQSQSVVTYASLGTEPTDPVTVNIVSEDTDIVSASPATITFSTMNWNVPQEITLLVESTAELGHLPIDVTFSTTSTDTAYNELSETIEVEVVVPGTVAIVHGVPTISQSTIVHNPNIDINYEAMEPYSVPTDFHEIRSADAVDEVSNFIIRPPARCIAFPSTRQDITFTVPANAVVVDASCYLNNKDIVVVRGTTVPGLTGTLNSGNILTQVGRDDYPSVSFLQGSLIDKIEIKDANDVVLGRLDASIMESFTDSVTDSFGVTWSWDYHGREWVGRSVFPRPSVVERAYMANASGSQFLLPEDLRLHDKWTFAFYFRYSVTAEEDFFWVSTDPYSDVDAIDSSALRIKLSAGNAMVDYSRRFSPAAQVESVSAPISLYDWHSLVVRRQPSTGLNVWVDGVNLDTTLVSTVVEPTENANLEAVESWVIEPGLRTQVNQAFGWQISNFAFFDRYLSDNHIEFLEAELRS